YPDVMHSFALHARQKPPGMILFYYAVLKLFPTSASIVGGLILGFISTLAVPATYLLARQMTGGDRNASFAAASYLSLCPALVLFYPSFDICFPLLTCAILGFWIAAMRPGAKMFWALATGAVLSLAAFMTYNLLTLGAFMVLAALWQIRTEGTAAMRRFLIISAAAGAVVVALYAILYLATGFNPVATFLAAVRNQRWMEENFFRLPRPWPQTIPGDLYDFLLGSAWISLPLLVMGLLRLARNRTSESASSGLIVLGVIQILIVALSGLLRVETSRVWAFMQPLVMIPIGYELARWPPGPRRLVFFCVWLATAAINQNMTFLLG
ncbi:MAG TPA: hypothetical protein VH518_23385, partial [Tepidisphaeraceae bacterium]